MTISPEEAWVVFRDGIAYGFDLSMNAVRTQIPPRHNVASRLTVRFCFAAVQRGQLLVVECIVPGFQHLVVYFSIRFRLHGPSPLSSFGASAKGRRCSISPQTWA